MLTALIRERVTRWLSDAVLPEAQVESRLRRVLQSAGISPEEVETVLQEVRETRARLASAPLPEAVDLKAAGMAALARAFGIPHDDIEALARRLEAERDRRSARTPPGSRRGGSR